MHHCCCDCCADLELLPHQRWIAGQGDEEHLIITPERNWDVLQRRLVDFLSDLGAVGLGVEPNHAVGHVADRGDLAAALDLPEGVYQLRKDAP